MSLSRSESGLPTESTDRYATPPIRTLANAILQVLNDADLRQRAAQQNLALIAQRANYLTVMTRASQLYRQVISNPDGDKEADTCVASPAS
jgi:hypothetical protein